MEKSRGVCKVLNWPGLPEKEDMGIKIDFGKYKKGECIKVFRNLRVAAIFRVANTCIRKLTSNELRMRAFVIERITKMNELASTNPRFITDMRNIII
jgi:hypothetical protein